ncbi:galactosylceramidase [Solihabitans fulvus]|uniref:galactosylceramidase n=1 Tax=Solihabitans fulvus TaxID=1892852 RepID=A0A5B2XBU5_9PSEU|nr:ricin-type beta-trefoil lectin domain protein [Solihabitans fulvus]KAA2260654.1 galactosylceramidase [Solihabitans fulvus]
MTSLAQRRFPVLAALAALLGGLFVLAAPAHAASSTSITVDGGKPGRIFDGVGAISGGGGNSRLLIDYPEPQRSQLLDYLFKPGYGASLQLLKLEIGGDTNSTDGAEASHMHTADTVDCNQGYEWWLAEQAKARNPDIKLYGLSWGAPSWVNPTANYFYTDNAITYLVQWLGCAKQHHLAIDYLGGWNERYYGGDATAKAWYEKLKPALAQGGYASTKIVGGDNDWSVANDMGADPAFKAAVDIVGVHYPCGYGGSFTSCGSIGSAQSLGNPLWASENGSLDYHIGATSVARALNRDYIDARMTAYLNWPVIGAEYPNLFFSDDGMSVANQPWSGHYDIGKTTWVTAQTTQFTRPGWHYIDSASGYLGGQGSHVTLKSTNNSDYSTVFETMDATAAQTVDVAVTGGLSTGRVHVWATNVKSANPADWFVRQPDITPSGGHYTVTLQPGYVYTATTTLPARAKGTATPPPTARLSLPYRDNFDTPAASTSPKYFSDMEGAFQRVACGGGRTGGCLRQMAPALPVRWTDEKYYGPYSIMGDFAWSNYTVSVDTMLERPGTVEVLGRVMRQAKNNNGLDAYHLRVTDGGAWSIVKTDQSWATTTLASGATNPLGTNTWHTIALTMQDSVLTAAVDGTRLGTATDSSYPNGQAGLGVGDFRTDQFDNFAVTPGTNPIAHVGPITSGLAGKCVKVGATSLVNATDKGNPAQLYDCDGHAEQVWAAANGALTHDGLCLDVTGQGTANLTPVEVWECNGGANQKWLPQADGTLKSAQSAASPGICLDDPSGTAVNGTQLIIYACIGGTNQKWTMPN